MTKPYFDMIAIVRGCAFVCFCVCLGHLILRDCLDPIDDKIIYDLSLGKWKRREFSSQTKPVAIGEPESQVNSGADNQGAGAFADL